MRSIDDLPSFSVTAEPVADGKYRAPSCVADAAFKVRRGKRLTLLQNTKGDTNRNAINLQTYVQDIAAIFVCCLQTSV